MRSGSAPARHLFSLLAAVLAGMIMLPTAAFAAEGVISYVEPSDEGVRVLVSVPKGADVDLAGVEVTIDGTATSATAEPAGTDTRIRRTSVLAIDTSNSMRGARFTSAKAAALNYLDNVPEDVFVGIVSFAADVADDLAPTLDRNQARAVIKGLTLSKQTRLYDAVLSGVELAGEEGQRSLLVLSDGADTSNTSLTKTASFVSDSEVTVNVVALEQSGTALAALSQLALAGDGEVISADSGGLAKTFSDEADILATQILVTAQVPDSLGKTEASIDILLPSVSGEPVTASAFSTVQDELGIADAGDVLRGDKAFSPPTWLMYAGIAALGVGLMIILIVLVPSRARPMSLEDRISTYSRAASNAPSAPSEKPESEAALTQAKTAAAGVLQRNAGLEAKISARLASAGSELKSSEWLLVHAAFFVGMGLLGLLLGGGGILIGILFLVVGAVGPWLYLGLRQSRRKKAFAQSLPDTLQLMSGSLAAGLSLAQSVDTIVREGGDPMASEFKRVLIETRLGVPLEDALDGITQRFESKDFDWVVMAIRIQRQVGGNLAELLDTVAATIREREYVRRQVDALAAEGKLSAYVLTALPPLFLLYLTFAQRDYVMPLFTDIRGLVMLVGATVWLLIGAFVMSKLIKVEV